MSGNSTQASILECQVCGRMNRVPPTGSGVPRCGNCGAPLPWIAEAGDDNFTEIAEDASVPVLIDLWAPWCGPCRTISPALENLVRNLAGRVKLVKVNVDEATNISRRFAVQGIPTLVILKGKREIGRQTGALPEHALRQWLEGALESQAKAS
jgi:thioredoxin 2